MSKGSLANGEEVKNSSYCEAVAIDDIKGLHVALAQNFICQSVGKKYEITCGKVK